MRLTRMLIAVAVFVFAYLVIISDRVNKTMVALVGAGLMVLLPAIDAPDVFYSQATGIDWDVIFLILGMMIIVSILGQTGAFEYTAIWAAGLGVVDRAGHTAGLWSAGDQPDTAFDGRGGRLEHRRHGDVGRRSTNHHHRRANGPVVQ